MQFGNPVRAVASYYCKICHPDLLGVGLLYDTHFLKHFRFEGEEGYC